MDGLEQILQRPAYAPYGYQYRPPYPSESTFFKVNPQVGGMAAQDNRVVMNPHSPLSATEKQAVAANEAIRLFMRNIGYSPNFAVTPEQQRRFLGSAYQSDPAALRQTLIARMLSGDPSAGQPTFEQDREARNIGQMIRDPLIGGGRSLEQFLQAVGR